MGHVFFISFDVIYSHTHSFIKKALFITKLDLYSFVTNLCTFEYFGIVVEKKFGILHICMFYSLCINIYDKILN